MKLPSPSDASTLAPVHPGYEKLPVWLEPQVLAYGRACAEAMREECVQVCRNVHHHADDDEYLPTIALLCAAKIATLEVV